MTQPMTHQAPFPPEQHITTNNTPEYKTWDRFEKLEFLLETTTQQFQDSLLDQIVSSMSEQEFTDTYEYITRMHGLARDHQELARHAQFPA